jgi:hypothetical protein
MEAELMAMNELWRVAVGKGVHSGGRRHWRLCAWRAVSLTGGGTGHAPRFDLRARIS